MSALVQTSKPTRSTPPVPSRVEDGVAVRYRGSGWQVSGAGLGDDLVFDRSDDAERLALGLARRRGIVARIYDVRGRLTHSYAG